VLLADWGGGYCVGLEVSNPTTDLAWSWAVVLDTRGAEIYDLWNGSSSANAGVVTVAPSEPWNQTLDPGETDTTIGFCANRTMSGSPTATLLATGAVFQ
jgi:hypothetical protein